MKTHEIILMAHWLVWLTSLAKAKWKFKMFFWDKRTIHELSYIGELRKYQ